jgi:alpha-tubulin suppressor-like RCC1 family protein
MGHTTCKRTAPGPTITFWLVGVMLSAVGCRDDRVAGPSEQGAAATPALTAMAAARAFSQVSTGQLHTCGVTAGGQLYCWGYNYYGALGDGTTNDHSVPTLVAGGRLFRQVSAGEWHTCAITTANRAFCWGYNANGELGDGTNSARRLVPVPVAGGRTFRQVSAGRHTCALTTSTTNKVYCWGSAYLGNGGEFTKYITPQLVSGARTYRQVAVGNDHTCALSTTSKVLCWGFNTYGQLGNGATAEFVARNPVAVAGTLQYRQVSAGGYHSCAVTTTNKAYCWGDGQYGQIGDGTTSSRFTPRAVQGGLTFGRVSGGLFQTCGETTGDRAYCWGYNGHGQVGDGTSGVDNQALTPAAVQGGHVFKQVATGGYHSCGVVSGDQAWCWGYNYYGELGNGTEHNLYVSPVAVQ